MSHYILFFEFEFRRLSTIFTLTENSVSKELSLDSLTYIKSGRSFDYLDAFIRNSVPLMRWKKAYDGRKESLMPKSHRPHSPHPNAHTEQEIKWIKDYHRRILNISLVGCTESCVKTRHIYAIPVPCIGYLCGLDSEKGRIHKEKSFT